MINRPSTTTSVFRHWGFGLRSSFVVRRSSFPVARHDCTEEQLGQRFCGTCPRIFLGKRAIIEGKEFRVPPTTAGNGRGRCQCAGGRAPFGDRSWNRRRQIVGLSHAGSLMGDRRAQKGNRLDAHDQSSGTTSLQRHPHFKEDSAGRV